MNPRGYKDATTYPILRGHNHCSYCLCSPCVIALPPDFLRGSCSPHPANCEKRYTLYRKFWGLLNDLEVWKDEEYLSKKENRTARHDKQDIMPLCVIKVNGYKKDCAYLCVLLMIIFYRKYEEGTQVMMGSIGTI